MRICTSIPITRLALLLMAFAACTGAVGTPKETADDGAGGGAGEDDDDDGHDARGGRGPSSPPGAGEVNACGLLPQRLWRLTSLQLESVLKTIDNGTKDVATALEKFVTDGGGASGLQLTVPHVEALVGKLEATAGATFAGRKAIAGCLEGTPSDECLKGSIEKLALKAFRRPPSPTEVDAYLSFYNAEKAVDGAEVAFRQMMQAILLSPHTLFRFELGAKRANGDVFELTAYEKASVLSFTLLDAPPDEELLEAASGGDLDSMQGVKEQAERLLARADAATALRRYFDEYMKVEAVMSVPKDDGVFPKFTDQVRADMLVEFQSFVKDVIWQGDGRLETLLTAPHTFLNKRLGAYYGLPGGSDDATWVRADANAQGRTGMLTMGSFLAAHGMETDTDVIRRGHFVREQILCDELPAPPANVNAFPLPPDGVLTQRERLVAHAENPNCAICHDLMDPIGFALEHFDGVGVYRSSDTQAKKPLNVSGFLKEDEEKIAFEGAHGLAKVVLEQPRAHTCFARRLEAFVAGRGLQEAGVCVADAGFVESLKTEGVRGGLIHKFSNPAFWTRAPVE